MTAEQLKEYGIRSIQLIRESSSPNDPKLLIAHLDGEIYSYPMSDPSEIMMKSTVSMHINKYYTRRIRREKLNRINGNYN